jgi:hypothetical protein
MCRTLFFATLAVYLSLTFFPARPAVAEPTTSAATEGLRHLPPDALAFIHIRFHDFMQTDAGKAIAGKWLDKDVAEIFFGKGQACGVKLSAVEELALFAPPVPSKALTETLQGKVNDKSVLLSIRGAAFGLSLAAAAMGGKMNFADLLTTEPPLVIITSTKPFDRKRIVATYLWGADRPKHQKEKEKKDKEDKGDSEAAEVSVLSLSDRALLIGDSVGVLTYADLQERDDIPAPFKKAFMKAGQTHHILAGVYFPVIKTLLQMGASINVLSEGIGADGSGRFDIDVATLSPLFNLRTAFLAADFRKEATLDIWLHGKNERTAKLGTELVKNLLVAAELSLDKAAKRDAQDKQRQAIDPLLRSARRACERARLEQHGGDVTLRLSSVLSAAELEKFAEVVAAWQASLAE